MNATPCEATVLVRGHGKLICEKEAGHEGPHEATLPGQWERVVWTDGNTSLPEPDR